MKLTIKLVGLCVVYLVLGLTSSVAESQNRFAFSGKGALSFSEPLKDKDRENFGGGWKKAIYTGIKGQNIDLLPMETFTSAEGVIFQNDFPPRISPTGGYAVLDVLRAIMVSSAQGEQPTPQSRQYCPVLDTQTGCIVSMQTGELCGGDWSKKDDNWIVGGKDQDDVDSAMLDYQFDSANVLWQSFLVSRKGVARYSIKSALKDNLGVPNMLTCEPPSALNRDAYTAIAHQLKLEGDEADAKYIEAKLAHAPRDGKPAPTSTIIVEKAPLYDQPDDTAHTKAYLVKGDQVTLLDTTKPDWILIKYVEKNGNAIEKWVRVNSVRSPG